jgi:hypothetical protein
MNSDKFSDKVIAAKPLPSEIIAVTKAESKLTRSYISCLSWLLLLKIVALSRRAGQPRNDTRKTFYDIINF